MQCNMHPSIGLGVTGLDWCGGAGWAGSFLTLYFLFSSGKVTCFWMNFKIWQFLCAITILASSHQHQQRNNRKKNLTICCSRFNGCLVSNSAVVGNVELFGKFFEIASHVILQYFILANIIKAEILINYPSVTITWLMILGWLGKLIAFSPFDTWPFTLIFSRLIQYSEGSILLN